MTERDAPEEALSLTVTRDTDRGGIERGRDENEIFLIFAERNRERDRVLPKEAGQCGVKRETGKKCLVKSLPSIILNACHVNFYWQTMKLGVYVEGNTL